MHRRAFLKLFGAALGSVLVMPGFFRVARALPVEAEIGNQRFRALGGDIYVTEDTGKTWQLHTKLGPELTVLDLFTDYSSGVYAQMGYKSFVFHLKLSPNGKHWITV